MNADEPEGKIFKRCICAKRLNDKVWHNDAGKLEWLLDEKETDPKWIPTCEYVLKEFQEQQQKHRIWTSEDGCEGCPIRGIIDPKKFRPLELDQDVEKYEPKVPPFPIEILEEPFKSYVEQVAESLHCPIDYPAMALFAYWSCIVGLKQEMVMKSDWIEPGVFWIAIVGRPSTVKSPALDKVRNFIGQIEERLQDEYRLEMNKYNESLVKYEEEKEVYNSIDYKNRLNMPKPRLPEEPETPRDYEINNYTVEALVDLLEKNPNGVACSQDELSYWIHNMDAYKPGNKGGTDRAFWLSAWNATKSKLIRKSYRRRLDRPFISLIGCLVPDFLKYLKYESKTKIDDGLTSRILFSYPEPVVPLFFFEPKIKDETFNEVMECFDWFDSQTIKKDKRNYNTDGWVKLMPGSKCEEIFEKWNNEVHVKQLDGIAEDLEHSWGKLKGYVARFTLLFHTMYEAAVKKEVMGWCSENSLKKAIKLVEYYFKPHLKKVYYYRSLSTDDKDLSHFLGWLKKHALSNDYLFDPQKVNRNYRPNNKRVPVPKVEKMFELLEPAHGIVITHKPKKVKGEKELPATKYFYLFKE